MILKLFEASNSMQVKQHTTSFSLEIHVFKNSGTHWQKPSLHNAMPYYKYHGKRLVISDKNER